MVDLSSYWKNLPDTSTPFEASVLNTWAAELEAAKDDAAGSASAAGISAAEAQAAAEVALAPTDGQVSALLDDSGSDTNASAQTLIDASGDTAATADTIARRDGAGALTVATPTAAGHAVTKAYADALSLSGALIGETGRDFRVVAGALRNDGAASYWQPISDAGHDPLNIDSVSTSTTAITVDYTGIGATKVVSFIVGADDTLTARGYVAGASVGLSTSIIHLAQTQPYADYVVYNGTTWVSQTGVFSLSFSAGVLTCTHPEIPGNSFHGAVSGRDGVLVPFSDGNSATAMLVKWRDWAGTLAATASTNMKAYVVHGANGPLDPQKVTTTLLPGSNLWFVGIFEV